MHNVHDNSTKFCRWNNNAVTLWNIYSNVTNFHFNAPKPNNFLMTTLLLPPPPRYLMDDDDEDRMIRITTGVCAAGSVQDESLSYSVENERPTPFEVANISCYSVTGEQIMVDEPQRPQRCSLDSATFVVPLNSLLRVSPVFAAMFNGQRFAESKTSEIALQGYSPESVAAFCSFISNSSSSPQQTATSFDNSRTAVDHNKYAGEMMLLDDALSSPRHNPFSGDFTDPSAVAGEVADFVRDLSMYDLQDLLLLCEQYQVQQLKHQIELALVECITVQNTFDMMVLACDARAPHLKRTVEKYAVEHFDDLCALGKWNEFRTVSLRTRNQAIEGEMTQTLIDELSKQFQSL